MAKSSVVLKWSKYVTCSKEKIDSRVPSRSGVYKLAQSSGAGKMKVFFVGQAEDLGQRVSNHLDASEPNASIKRTMAKSKCKVAFATLASPKQRDGVERALYDYYAPACNSKAPAGVAIEANPRNVE
jgi:excinuclease UvrABC nuclease subunit